MPFLYTPPARRTSVALAGHGLRYSVWTSLTTYKDANGWHAEETPPDDVIVAALKSLPGRPVVVDDATAAELRAAGLGTLSPL